MSSKSSEAYVSEEQTPPGTEAARIAFDDLASLNLDAYEGCSIEEIGAALTEIAERASPAQLETILEGLSGTGDYDEGDKPALVERYVAWRLDTIKRLRNLRDTLVIEGLD